ncbi:UNVERIFIED_CONTAM: hypothetical protein FKN15_074952 [Acipenser sinensis]
MLRLQLPLQDQHISQAHILDIKRTVQVQSSGLPLQVTVFKSSHTSRLDF